MSERTKGGSIDIVVGGQFGDESKGQVCAHLMVERKYDFAVRVGGSNAEHRFCNPQNERFCARVLPVAAWIDPKIKIFLGAGHVIKLDSLFAEIYSLKERWGCDQTDRIFIDPQAGVVAPVHVTKGKKTWERGSTRQGIGASVAHKVLRDGTYKLAQDYYKLQPYIKGRVNEMIYEMLQHNGVIGLLEGNQGALLSLDHGFYPYNTSKNPTPTGLLAELGIGMKWVRDIYAAYRCIPMRVPGKSGPSRGQELSWDELEK
ncbi:MAG: adenylosuccinate synthetase, partial [Ignavibacteria bacterium]|nr:adenylosuccinate synthetase [Ignavibacteria bacterium]